MPGVTGLDPGGGYWLSTGILFKFKVRGVPAGKC